MIMIKKIKLPWKQFEKYCEIFDKMFFTADTYCPTKEDLIVKAMTDWKNCYLFLLWVQMTGIETEENKEDRQFLNNLLNKYLEIV